VAGIGQPDQFFATLEKLGFQVQPHAFGDHHDFSALDFNALADKPIIMTEKDAVKCRALAGANAWYLKIEAQLPPALIEAVAALARP
jgi:tetraacyldisaccharide 4'-kinase